ncbi:MAG: tetratricopeptide repeat protein [Saprospiraceae bacterium]
MHIFTVKNLTESLKRYNYAIDHNAKNSDYALYQKAIILGLNDKMFEKIALLNDVIGKYPNSGIRPLALFELAGTYQDIGQYEKAYTEYSAIVNNYKSNTQITNKALMQMGLISYNKGSLDESIENYKAVIANNPNADTKREALNALEEIYINDKKNPSEYIEFMKNEAGIDASNINSDSLNFVTARIFFESDSVDNALNSLNQYLDTYDKGYYALDARFYRAESYLQKKDYKAAVKDYEYIIAQGYNNYYEPSLYKAAVINFNYLKNYNKAIDEYKQLSDVIKDENKKYEAQLGIMRSAFMINDFENVNSYGNFILNNPLTTDKEKSAAHYYIGKVAVHDKKYDVALIHLNKVINENPNSNLAAESRYLISLIYYERNEIDLAKK